MPTFSIGQLAKRSGVAIDTVRHYERSRPLAPAGRLASGYRRYRDNEIMRRADACPILNALNAEDTT